MQLSQKEMDLLKDLKGQEKLCVEKYSQHAQAARDNQLKQLLNDIGSVEQRHLDTITQMEKGTVPQTSQQSSQKPTGGFTATYTMGDNEDKKNDCYICSDLLATEKHVSSLYDTCIFEFKDEQLRTTLNHIQSEEQEHGKLIYDYMSKNNMYS